MLLTVHLAKQQQRFVKNIILAVVVVVDAITKKKHDVSKRDFCFVIALINDITLLGTNLIVLLLDRGKDPLNWKHVECSREPRWSGDQTGR